MPEEQDLSSIYVCDEEFEIEINGVVFKWKELSGTEISRIMGSEINPEKIDSSVYIKKLIRLAVFEPRNIDVDKLKPKVLVLLVQEIENSLGLSEVMQKNLNSKSEEIPPTTLLPTNSENV